MEKQFIFLENRLAQLFGLVQVRALIHWKTALALLVGKRLHHFAIDLEEISARLHAGELNTAGQDSWNEGDVRVGHGWGDDAILQTDETNLVVGFLQIGRRDPEGAGSERPLWRDSHSPRIGLPAQALLDCFRHAAIPEGGEMNAIVGVVNHLGRSAEWSQR